VVAKNWFRPWRIFTPSNLMNLFEPKAWASIPSSGFQAMYFGDLEVVAYEYNPGGTIQANANWGNSDKDWSYWVVLQGGSTSSRNNIIEQGSVFDLSTLGSNSLPPGLAFKQSSTQFSVDVYEVYIDQTAVLYSGELFGGNYGSNGLPFQKYPTLSENTVAPTVWPYYQVLGQQPTLNVWFVRDDWFPSPVLVTMTNRTTIGSSSVSLTAEQQTIITSLTSQGTGRRGYDELVIVPFSQFHGPFIVKFPEALGAGQSRDIDEPIASTNPMVWGDNTLFKVNFTLDDSILVAPPSTSDNTVTFNGDSHDVPYGVSVSLEHKDGK
jgi:hypothetical protein